MKKRERKIELIIFLVISSLFLIPQIYALDIQLAKSQYYPGETIQADILGSFSGGLTKEKILLCRGDEVNPIAVSSNLAQMSDKFLFYALTSSSLTAGDYSLKIKSTITPTCLSDIIFSEPIKIISPTDEPYIQINPGFITSLNNNNQILIKTLGFIGVQNVNLNFLATSETKNFTLVDGAGRNLYLNTEGLYGNLVSSVTVNDYTIPVYLSLPLAPENQTEEIILGDEVDFSPDSLNLVVLNDTDYEVNFSVINSGNNTIQDISLSSGSGKISLSKSFIDELAPYTTIKITVDFKISESLKTNITLTYKEQTIFLPVLINITHNPSNVDIESNFLAVNPENFNKYVNFSKNYKFNFTVINQANRTITDIALSCDNENVKLDKTEISSIKQGKNITLYFDVNTNETIDSQIEITYDNETIILPVLFRENKEEEYNLDENLIFYPEEMNGTFLLGKEYSIILVNMGEKDLEDIELSCEDKNIEFKPIKIAMLKSYKKTYVNLTITSGENINTLLVAEWDNQKISLPINGVITEDESEEQIDTGDYESYPTCMENGGVTCKTKETCNGELDTDIRLANCCYGTCQADSSSATKWIIGVIILIVLGLGGFYLYSKYKNQKGQDSSNIIKGRAKDFESRMNPKEVRGSLGKI
jgi:hypothetical protein